jgi:hypothetical protein
MNSTLLFVLADEDVFDSVTFIEKLLKSHFFGQKKIWEKVSVDIKDYIELRKHTSRIVFQPPVGIRACAGDLKSIQNVINYCHCTCGYLHSTLIL